MIDSDDRDAMRSYIAAADKYFRDLDDPQALFSKPYLPLRESPYNAVRLGYLLAHLRHNPLHTVLDFGAGMCWLTIGLHRTGCRVIALDVSRVALELGERAFHQAGFPPDRPRPQFCVYDGYTFPLEDGSVDRIACYDALHHVPNKRTVLREMFRVLRSGGHACFVEPGPGHSVSPDAVHDTEHWGVLEDEIDATVLCAIAEEIGFRETYTVPLPDPLDNRFEPEDFRRLRLGERRGVLNWSGNDALIVLIKDTRDVNSRNPQRLWAKLAVEDFPQSASPGETVAARVRVVNIGDTRWLALPAYTASGSLDYEAAFLDKTIVPGTYVNDEPVRRYRAYIESNRLQGMVTLGARLWDLNAETAIDLDYARGFLPADVDPRDAAETTMQLRAPWTPGLYCVTFDAVDEYLTWFQSEGSHVAVEYLRVEGEDLPPDSRAPRRLDASLQLIDQQPGGLMLSVTNSGDTVWLKGPLHGGGFVQFGVQRLDHTGQIVDRDWLRFPLPRCVWPGETLQVRLDVASHSAEGVPAVRIDLLSELRCWFSDRGTTPLTVRLRRV